MVWPLYAVIEAANVPDADVQRVQLVPVKVTVLLLEPVVDEPAVSLPHCHEYIGITLTLRVPIAVPLDKPAAGILELA